MGMIYSPDSAGFGFALQKYALKFFRNRNSGNQEELRSIVRLESSANHLSKVLYVYRFYANQLP